MVASRKDPRNFGTGTALQKEAEFPVDPNANAGRYPVVMPERVFLALLRYEIGRLSSTNNRDECVRLFSHFFDPMISEAERNSYVNNFQNKPPKTYLGYPRSSSKFPCYAVVLESDEEADEALDHLIDRTGDNENSERTEDFLGSMYDQTYGIYVYAENPDVCLYLYKFAKAVLIGSHETIEGCGILDLHLSGAELSPDEAYMPENMFLRVLRAKVKTLETVPHILRPDPARVRITGIYVDDIVVSGIRGGVSGV